MPRITAAEINRHGAEPSRGCLSQPSRPQGIGRFLEFLGNRVKGVLRNVEMV
jgi:hypothetical protein